MQCCYLAVLYGGLRTAETCNFNFGQLLPFSAPVCYPAATDIHFEHVADTEIAIAAIMLCPALRPRFKQQVMGRTNR